MVGNRCAGVWSSCTSGMPAGFQEMVLPPNATCACGQGRDARLDSGKRERAGPGVGSEEGAGASRGGGSPHARGNPHGLPGC